MAGVEVVALGVLVFVVGSLVLASGWRLVDAKFAAAAAAREATRTFVEASGSTGAARAQARAVAAATLADYGVPRGQVAGVSIDGALERCRRVTVTVTLRLESTVLPWVGRAPGADVRADHSELVDPLRSGLDGEAACVGA